MDSRGSIINPKTPVQVLLDSFGLTPYQIEMLAGAKAGRCPAGVSKKASALFLPGIEIRKDPIEAIKNLQRLKFIFTVKDSKLYWLTKSGEEWHHKIHGRHVDSYDEKEFDDMVTWDRNHNKSYSKWDIEKRMDDHSKYEEKWLTKVNADPDGALSQAKKNIAATQTTANVVLRTGLEWLRSIALGGMGYAIMAPVIGLEMNLWGAAGVIVGGTFVTGTSFIADRRKNKPKVAAPKQLEAPKMHPGILEAQRNIAALDHRKFAHDLPTVPSGWSVEDQRNHNDLYWQGEEAFWLNPKVYEGGKLDLFAPDCPAPAWWKAPVVEDVIDDQIDLVAMSLEDPHPPQACDVFDELDHALDKMEAEDDYKAPFIKKAKGEAKRKAKAGRAPGIGDNLSFTSQELISLLKANGPSVRTHLVSSRIAFRDTDGTYEGIDSNGRVVEFATRAEADEWAKRTMKPRMKESMDSISRNSVANTRRLF